jgi:hypothetical protein
MAFARTRNNTPTVKATVSNGGNSEFAPITPGFYLARIDGAKEGNFQGGFKGVSGKFNYLKITPEIVVLNEVGTTINRQDLIVGAVDSEGFLFRPDGNTEKPALYSEMGFFLSAVGFIDDEGNVDLNSFDPRLLCGQVVSVKIENETYDKDGEQRKKNVVRGFFPVKDKHIEEYGLVLHGGFYFQNEDDARHYEELYDAIADEAVDFEEEL